MVERERAYAAPSADEHRIRAGHEAGSPAELLSDLRPFWRAVYGEAPGLLGFFSGRRQGPRLRAPREIYFLWPSGAHHAAAWLADEVARVRDVYQCAHLLTRPRRLKRYAAPLAALYVDLDHATLGNAGVPKPSVVVESSPGRLQCYWQLLTAVDPLTGEALNRRLAYALGADRSGWDLTQLLRIPGTVNHKYEDRPTVRLVAMRDVRYDPDELAASLPQLMPRTRETHRLTLSALPPVGSDPPIPLTRSALKRWNGEDVKLTPQGTVDRSASLVRIARLLRQAGLSPDDIAAALAERDASLGWNKYSGRQDAVEQYRRIVDLVGLASPTRRWK
jgi:hypothetical protein